ncbi:sodium bile acid symporter family-domain-containing protein [Mycena maculata]|uniref:Sodium bile acid symporter family-domain-containing protein n=1 Tax=Mycena maculata TaxID=230809 RepID=A0AAD7I989_9AGAR|nr:sodium bile acid symporter family-domain-containing protein [Mycena maculata]
MVVGVLIGEYVPSVQGAFNSARFDGVSILVQYSTRHAIMIGLIIMMWPVLTKVQYETIPQIFRASGIWTHVGISLLFNWVIGPLVMLGLAWATLPDLPTYRMGVIMVGIARCIAMVLIWCQLTKGDGNYCAILVVINSVLQMVLYSLYTLLFINVMGGRETSHTHLDYGHVTISVLIYLGIPLVAGILTRYTVWSLTSKTFLDNRFIRAPRSAGHHIVQNIGLVFRVFVPMILYFVIMWSVAFSLIYWFGRSSKSSVFGYEMAVVQAFTASSNNFELAIAIAIATCGVGSDEALAAAIGPLVEVPVLLALTWVALYLQGKLKWTSSSTTRRARNNLKVLLSFCN